MNDQMVSKDRVTAIALWVIVGALMLSAWLVIWLVPEGWMYGGLLAATACASSAVAASLQIKCYTGRVCTLLRALHGPERERASLHRVP